MRRHTCLSNLKATLTNEGIGLLRHVQQSCPKIWIAFAQQQQFDVSTCLSLVQTNVEMGSTPVCNSSLLCIPDHSQMQESYLVYASIASLIVHKNHDHNVSRSMMARAYQYASLNAGSHHNRAHYHAWSSRTDSTAPVLSCPRGTRLLRREQQGLPAKLEYPLTKHHPICMQYSCQAMPSCPLLH